jgi:hypothetical protein
LPNLGLNWLPFTPILPRFRAAGAVDFIFGVIARVTVIPLRAAGGGSVMKLNYGAIAAQMDDLKQCAREALREGRDIVADWGVVKGLSHLSP